MRDIRNNAIKVLFFDGGNVLFNFPENRDARIVSILENHGFNRELVYKAMAYQISKEIGALATVLEGKVDAILLTGGVAYDKRFCGWIKTNAGFIAEIKVFPGEDEMRALAEGGLYAMKGELPIHTYQ